MKRISTWQARWTFLKAAILLASILYLSAVDELERLENAVGAAMCGVLFLSILIPLRRISRSNGNQETAGLDVILALLDPANGHRWDQMPFTIRRPKGKRLRTVISILFWEAFVLFWGIFWQVTGQMTPELLESWGILTALLTLWSIRRWCKVLRCRIHVDGAGLTIIPAFDRKRSFLWGSFELDWEKDGFPKLPGQVLTGWDQSLFKLLCALRDNGLLTDEWEVFHNV